MEPAPAAPILASMDHGAPTGLAVLRRDVVLTTATGLAVLLAIAARFGFSGDAQTLIILIGLVALVLTACVASALRSGQPGSESFGWKVLAFSLFISALVQALRLPTFLGHPLAPWLRNLSFMAQVVNGLLPLVALLTWHLAPRSTFDRIRNGLDGLLFALAVFFILWGLVLGPVFLSDRFHLIDRLLWLGTFLNYDLLLGLAVYFGLAEPSRFRGPLGWLAIAFLVAGLHNFVWLVDVLSGMALFHLPIGPLIYAVPLAYLAAARSPRPVDTQAVQAVPTPLVHLLPYIPVLGALTLGIWLLVTGSGPGPRFVLVWLALGLVVVLLVRQYLALRDFSILSRHLETRVEERTRALEKAQAMLLRTERMNAMATLGAGLAHDMNNLLSAIQCRTELVIADLDEGRQPDRHDLVQVQEASHHVSHLSRRLMAMGHQDSEPPQSMDLVQELRAIQPLLQVLLHGNQQLRVDGGSGPALFLGTRGTLEQILVNLVSNARDAMPSGGIITLRARASTDDEGQMGPLLEIEDTGGGIPVDQQSKVFQPFFTTKAAGSGTGLGLVSVKANLDQMGGSIGFVSRVGQGTIFQIRLPRLPEGF